MKRVRSLILAAAVIAALVAWGGSPLAPRSGGAAPANDNFGNATPLTIAVGVTDPVVAVGDNIGATTETGEPSPCGSIAATTWYQWTAPAGAGTITFSTFGSTYDTVLAVYTGSAVNALTLVQPGACNDDFGGLQSGVPFVYNVLAPTTFWIQVGGYNGATGSVVLNESFGASMVVTTPTDNQIGDFDLSLREAIIAATTAPACGALTPGEQALALNCIYGGTGAADLIHFSSSAFPSGAPATIALGTNLPALSATGDVVSGIGAGVIVDGQNLFPFGCLRITGSFNIVQGLDIRRCHRGIRIDGGFSNVVGIDISNLPVLPQQRNIIRESTVGVEIMNTAGTNFLYGNFVGTNEAGTAGLGNLHGVTLDDTSFQQIGSPGTGRNVISGNSSNGIQVTSSLQSRVSGNLIGANPAGTAALANGGYGVLLQDSNESLIETNVVSGNTLAGIQAFAVYPGITAADRNSIAGNLVGVDATGTVGIPNGEGGIVLQNSRQNVVGGTSVAQRNVVSGNTRPGVWIVGAYSTRNTVQGNYIGTNAAGTAALANVGNGVEVNVGATSNTIGGTTAGAGNLISGNLDYGIALAGPGGGISSYSSSDVPKAITDFATTTSVINVAESGLIKDVNVTIGSLTHTWDSDLTISLTNPDGATVLLSANNGGSGDHYIGTTFDDEQAPFPFIKDGVAPFTGTYVPEGFLSSFDGGLTKGTWTLTVTDSASGDIGTLNAWSLTFTTDGNEVVGNHIGTNAAGTAALGNMIGVVVVDSPSNIIGGSVPGARNVISGNNSYGVEVQGGSSSDNRVTGNYIGTDVTGAVDLGNGADGVNINGAPSNYVGGEAVNRNVISGNQQDGVIIQGAAATGNYVSGNYIGTNSAGSSDLGNTRHGVSLATTGHNTIGSGAPEAGNVISGNDQHGVRVFAATTGSLIQGNFIGTNAIGTQAIANSGNGIFLLGGTSNVQIGGATPLERNIISGNAGHGVDIQQPGTAGINVQGNYIGTKVDGVTPLGNGAGVGISGGASYNRIGGTNPGEGNTIAFNTTRGIGLLSSGGFDPIENRIQQNRIFGNGGLGIDLGQDGVTANDAGDGDSGPNGLQNSPELLFASYVGGQVNISGALRSIPFNAYKVEFFSSPDCDPSGYGEGATFLGRTDVSTDAAGFGSFGVGFVSPPLTGFLTAVAIDDDATYNASEFSKCTPADASGDDDGDGYVNYNEAGTPLCLDQGNSDAFDDGVTNDGCPGGPAKVGTFSEAQFTIGTGSVDPCGYDGWPSNVWDAVPSNNQLDIQDVISFVAPVRRLDKSPADAGFGSRWDLVPGTVPPFTKFINIVDITTLVSGPAGSPAFPPMLSPLRAFGKDCPLAP